MLLTAKDETLWLLRMLHSYAVLRALKWWCWGRLSGETKILISVFSKKQNPYGGVKDQGVVDHTFRYCSKNLFTYVFSFFVACFRCSSIRGSSTNKLTVRRLRLLVTILVSSANVSLYVFEMQHSHYYTVYFSLIIKAKSVLTIVFVLVVSDSVGRTVVVSYLVVL